MSKGILAIVALLALLVGCATTPAVEEQLIGRWRSSSGEVWQFNADKSLVIEDVAKSKLLFQGPLAGRGAARVNDVRFTWSIVSAGNPNRMDIIASIPDGDIRVKLETIQDFPNKSGMRVGADGFGAPAPKNFESAKAVENFLRLQGR